MSKPERAKFVTRRILLRGEQQRGIALALIAHIPLDDESPIEMLVREEVQARKLSQNALMWVGPLADIASQAWTQGRQYSAEVWHIHMKQEYLPEEDDQDLGELVKDPFTYRKWDWTPGGDRVLVGSTTQLTKRGFGLYLTRVEAFGASMGVQFSEGPG